MIPMLAQLNPDATTIFGTAASFIGAMVIKDFIRDRLSNRHETTKIGELSEQTQILREIRDQQELCGKKTRKRLKRLREDIKKIIKPKGSL